LVNGLLCSEGEQELPKTLPVRQVGKASLLGRTTEGRKGAEGNVFLIGNTPWCASEFHPCQSNKTLEVSLPKLLDRLRGTVPGSHDPLAYRVLGGHRVPLPIGGDLASRLPPSPVTVNRPAIPIVTRIAHLAERLSVPSESPSVLSRILKGGTVGCRLPKKGLAIRLPIRWLRGVPPFSEPRGPSSLGRGFQPAGSMWRRPDDGVFCQTGQHFFSATGNPKETEGPGQDVA